MNCFQLERVGLYTQYFPDIILYWEGMLSPGDVLSNNQKIKLGSIMFNSNFDKKMLKIIHD